MSDTTKFSQKAFRQGVDDVLTLAPIRDAVRSLLDNTSTKSKGETKGSGLTGHTKGGVRHIREATRKAG